VFLPETLNLISPRFTSHRRIMNDTTNLLADETNWQRTFDAVPDLIFILDNQQRIVHANRAAAERLGCTCEQLAGQLCHTVMHGTERPPDHCPHSQLLRDGKPHSIEFDEPRPQGHFAVSVRPICGVQGEVVGAVHVARDISEFKRIETELRQARDHVHQRYALAVASTLDGLWEWDIGSGRVEYSPRWETLLGYSREEIPATLDFFERIVHPDDADAVWAAVDSHLADQMPFEFEFRLRTQAGDYRWFLGRGQAQWDAAGQPIHMAGAIQDITKRKNAEAARDERARFERLLSEISARFAGGPPGDLDAEIACALEQIRRFFQIDQIAFLKYDSESSFVVHPSHWAAADGVAAIPTDVNGRLLFPWIHAQLRFGEPLILRREDLPVEAGTDRESFARFGLQSAVVVPLLLHESPQYLLCLGAFGTPRPWPAEIVVRLRLLGEIFMQSLLHRQADAELREAELKYRTLAEFSTGWEHWQAPDGAFRYLSPSCEAITGVPLQDYHDNPGLLYELVLPEDKLLWQEHFLACHEGHEAGTFLFRIRRRDGRIVWLEHTCRPVLDERGQYLGTRVSNRDVTERKQAEEALQIALMEITLLKERLEKENVHLHDVIKGEHGFGEIVGQSEPLRITLHKVEHVADTDTSVLLLGETGSGKELFARAVHQRSRRAARPLVKVNCAALPASLIESELFGHVKGAFTGALADKIGRFELADRGTLFLDEIGELDPDLQAKLLRVLQEGEFERIGSNQTIRVDVRLIAATNRNLHDAMRDGSFRADLYYRLSVFPIEVPPLRARRDDIPLLVWHFITRKQRRLGKNIDSVPREVLDQLVRYDWPGNVRELENVIERAMILSPGPTLVLSEPLVGAGPAPPPDHPAPAVRSPGSLQEIDRAHIVAVLDECGWKVKGDGNAAARLGLKPSTLRFRMKKLGIQRRPKPR
jgi:formate hydrogenlyase transcriptional activator